MLYHAGLDVDNSSAKSVISSLKSFNGSRNIIATNCLIVYSYDTLMKCFHCGIVQYIWSPSYTYMYTYVYVYIIYVKEKNLCIVPRIPQVCCNKFTLHKCLSSAFLKRYRCEIMTICSPDRFVAYTLTAFWVPHMSLINSALLFLKTDCLPCASCLVTHTLAWLNTMWLSEGL